MKLISFKKFEGGMETRAYSFYWFSVERCPREVIVAFSLDFYFLRSSSFFGLLLRFGQPTSRYVEDSAAL